MALEATPLVSAERLAENLTAGGLVILDIRSGNGAEAAFAAGHVPGSRHADYARGWRIARDGAGGLLPDATDLRDLFETLGLGAADHVIIVPAGESVSDFGAAARIYWTLKVAGHERVSILDGGHAGWVAAGRPIETGRSEAPARSSYPVAIDPTLRATLAEVETALAGKRATLLDARSLASFEGAEKSPQAARAGRLPGARLVDASAAFDPTLHGLKRDADLEAAFGAVPDGPVISYCNTGHSAATNWFVLSEMLRRPDVRLYDGSMSQWSADPARPVETGKHGSESR